MRYFILLLCVLSGPVWCAGQSTNDQTVNPFDQTFIPDHTFQGSDLQGWHPIGHSAWKADQGTITVTQSSGQSGLLVLDTPYQDIGITALLKCNAQDEAGILFRLTKIATGYKGVLLAVSQKEVAPFAVTLNDQGVITSRKKLRRAGGIGYRIAPPPPKNEGGRRAFQFPPRPAPPADLPIHQPDASFKPNTWNQIEIFMDENMLRSFLNDGPEIGGAVDDSLIGIDGYGPIALYASGTAQFKNILYKDIAVKITPAEKTSPRFTLQRISDMYYSWGATAADFDRDGQLDIVAGAYIYYGPDFTRRREIYPAIAANPSNEFNNNHIEDAYDFNGDGWPDLLYSAFSTTLYINPGKHLRRWKSYDVLPGARQGEITSFVDIDGDGKPELVYAANNYVRYAQPDPSDPTKPWKEHNVSKEGYGASHGIGTGDINDDGRIDILNAYGWWENPGKAHMTEPWKYHPAVLGRYGKRNNHVGGSIMGVYDVNGDGLKDVVSSLNAHGFGLAWFEQHRGKSGKISFTTHMISDDYSYPNNAGDVTFSQSHGNTFADVDGDGIPDLIIGKRYWTHLDNYYDPDPYGPPVLYWYKTVRNASAPGGAKFVPELIHNRSGAGSQITAMDLDKDGKVDLITSTDRGTFIFWNRPSGK